MNTSSVFKLSALTLTIGLLATGCAFNTPADRNVVVVSDEWRFAQSAAASVDTDWWRSFSSTELNQFIELAASQSPDLRIASERVLQAEYNYKNTGASLLPDLSASASSGESRNKSDAPSAEWTRSESSRVGLNINYEVDLWGRLRANRDAAQANYKASIYDLEASRLTLYGAIATTYFQWLSLNERIKTAENNLIIAERVYQIVEARYRNGVVTAADVARQKSTLLSQQSNLAPLRLQAEQARASLAVLLGQTPQQFDAPLAKLLNVNVPSVAPVMPSELLTRRPDIAAAEAGLAASDANLVAARAAMLPSFSLSASVGQNAANLFSLTGAGSSTGWTASVAQSIFQGGRLRSQVNISESQQRVLVETYRKVVLVSLQEVDDALLSASTQAELETLQADAVEQAEKTLRITELRYREGSDDMTSLLDAQRSLFAAQDSLVQQRFSRLTAAINLYKALGGGWQVPTSTQ